MRNPILKRLFIIFLIIMIMGAAAYFAFKVLLTNNTLYYYLDENVSLNDKILTNFKEYQTYIKDFNINQDLNNNDFENNYYLATIQDFDKCSEYKVKGIDNVSVINNNITVHFIIYNKCGWCKSSKVLYLIKIDKVDPNININFDYAYNKTLECGKV